MFKNVFLGGFLTQKIYGADQKRSQILCFYHFYVLVGELLAVDIRRLGGYLLIHFSQLKQCLNQVNISTIIINQLF